MTGIGCVWMGAWAMGGMADGACGRGWEVMDGRGGPAIPPGLPPPMDGRGPGGGASLCPDGGWAIPPADGRGTGAPALGAEGPGGGMESRTGGIETDRRERAYWRIASLMR